jgi:hypothetical protein
MRGRFVVRQQSARDVTAAEIFTLGGQLGNALWATK